jgi:hypothetical protein
LKGKNQAGVFYITPGIAKDVMMALMEGQKRADGDDEPWAKLTGALGYVLKISLDEIGFILAQG